MVMGDTPVISQEDQQVEALIQSLQDVITVLMTTKESIGSLRTAVSEFSGHGAVALRELLDSRGEVLQAEADDWQRIIANLELIVKEFEEVDRSK